MKQDDVDSIFSHTKDLIVWADKIIDKLDFLSKEKDKYNNFIFVNKEKVRVAGKWKIIKPQIHPHRITIPDSTQYDIDAYLALLHPVVDEVNNFISDLHQTDVKLSEVYKFINLKVQENQEKARMVGHLNSRLTSIYIMLDVINKWLLRASTVGRLNISNDPMKMKLMIQEMTGLQDTITQFLDSIGSDFKIAKNFQLFFERLQREGFTS